MNVIDLLSADGIILRKASGKDGGEYHGPCPGCGGADRFHVWMEQNSGEGSYWCRQCEKSGDMIQYLIDFHGKTYSEACAALDREVKQRSRQVTPVLAEKRKRPAWEPKAMERPADLWREKAEKFVFYCHDALLKSPGQMRYLADRGLSRETVIGARLGLNTENRWRPREAWGLPTIMKESGKPKKLWLPMGLVIPWFDVQDTLVRVRIRRPKPRDPEKPKYFVLPGSSGAPMVLGAHREAFALIESELDGLLVYQEAGDLIGVCALGSASNRPDAAAASVLKEALHILNCLDYDAAGAKEHAFWAENYPQTVRWPTPKGKDPGEAVGAGVDLRSWVVAGLPPRWRIQAAIPKSRREDPEPKREPEQVQEQAQVLGVQESVPGNLGIKIMVLARLLDGHPVAVVRGPGLGIDKPFDWSSRHWDVLGEISALVFHDKDVSGWLLDLPPGRYFSQYFGMQGANIGDA